jgi:hypothetical protein
MPEPISISKALSIRDCGYNEDWLQEQIATNPSIIGLGELDLVKREKAQSSGGRLDILLENSEDDSMFEVEVMLGATDESHIIRAIEYWDLERKRWPQRQHTVVLIAETITRRFFNVIQLLSLSIPIMAIQANILEADGKRFLNFTRVLDAYEEPDTGRDSSSGTADVNYWLEKAPWAVEAAKALWSIIQPHLPGVEMDYVKSYIGFYLGNDMCFWFHKRGSGKALLTFWVAETEMPEVRAKLDRDGIPYTVKNQRVKLTVDKKMIEANAGLFAEIAQLVRLSWKL